jgi:histone H3/H4
MCNFGQFSAERPAQPIRSIRPPELPGRQFRRLMGAMMRARMLVAAIAATLGLLTVAIAGQAQAVKHAHRVTVATLHRP